MFILGAFDKWISSNDRGLVPRWGGGGRLIPVTNVWIGTKSDLRDFMCTML